MFRVTKGSLGFGGRDRSAGALPGCVAWARSPGARGHKALPPHWLCLPASRRSAQRTAPYAAEDLTRSRPLPIACVSAWAAGSPPMWPKASAAAAATSASASWSWVTRSEIGLGIAANADRIDDSRRATGLALSSARPAGPRQRRDREWLRAQFAPRTIIRGQGGAERGREQLR